MDIAFESVVCPDCGLEKQTVVMSAPDRFKPDDGYKFQVVQCLSCGFILLNPRPDRESIASFYTDSDYQPFVSVKDHEDVWDRIYGWVRACALRNKRRKIEKLNPSGRLLDVGCGTGEFLNEMKNAGWAVVGMETNKAAARYAHEKYDLSVAVEELHDCNFLDKSFDIVTMWHVLEHVFDPKQTLQTIEKLLRDDGALLVAAPNIASLDARYYRENWVALDSPRHLSHFTPESIRRLCASANLELIDSGQMLLDVLYNCLLSETLTIRMKSLSRIFLPFFAVRAGLLAVFSMVNASRIRPAQNRQGSSNLYLIKKAG